MYRNTSCFFIRRDPNRFGNQQQDYIENVECIVKNATTEIKNAVKENADLEALFHVLLNKFGQFRGDIARRHATLNASKFGVLRSTESSLTEYMLHTPLFEVYEGYNTILLSRLKEYLSSMKHNIKEFTQKEYKKTHRVCMGRQNSTQILIHSPTVRTLQQSREEYNTICKLSGIEPLDESHDLASLYNHLLNKNNMRTIKEHAIAHYKKLKFDVFVKDAYQNFSGKKSDWVLVTNRCEIDGKLYALTQYITWMYRTFQHDPVEYMTQRHDPTIITLIHQDIFLMEDTLNEVARLFKQVIGQNKLSEVELKQQVGLIVYLFSHATPYQRGTAAICEWLEMSIYAYHGYVVNYNSKYSINMEALIRPLSEFIPLYSNMIEIEQTTDMIEIKQTTDLQNHVMTFAS